VAQIIDQRISHINYERENQLFSPFDGPEPNLISLPKKIRQEEFSHPNPANTICFENLEDGKIPFTHGL